MQKKRRIYLDTEANSLRPTLIHCIVCRDIDTGQLFTFKPLTPLGGHKDFKETFLAFLEEVEELIGHNLIGFDIPVLERLLEIVIKGRFKVTDTLVLSRLLRPTFMDKATPKGFYDRRLGHSLEAWGKYLKYSKGDFKAFECFTEEMLEYCIRDTELGILIYQELKREFDTFQFSQFSVDLEHDVAFMLREQEDNGFYLYEDRAKALVEETSNLLKEYDKKLQELFPPQWKHIRDLELTVKKDGEEATVPLRILKSYQSNPQCKAELSGERLYKLYVLEVFNPESGKQIAERLLQVGWVPKRYTEKGAIKTDQETLQEALKELITERPELASVQCLSDYSVVSDRNQKTIKWLELAKERGDGRVHGRVNPIGASTHRASHYSDNMANIASVVVDKSNAGSFSHLGNDWRHFPKFGLFDNNKLFLRYDEKKQEVHYALKGLAGAFGWDSRACWGVGSSEFVLVGADAAGIQLRALAHYMGDPRYIKEVCEGDVHVVNQKAAGIKDRPTSKTFIYAWLLGGGDEKIGKIVGLADIDIKPILEYGRGVNKWGKTLVQYFIDRVRSENRKADEKTIATIIKGHKTKKQFLDKLPALKRFKTEDIPMSAKQGYVLGLDGRKIWVPSEHLTMGAYLQGFETVVMRLAMKLYQEDLNGRSIPFWQVCWSHDEYQVETPKEFGDIVGRAIVMAIRKAGVILKTLCPLDGEYKIGSSWSETH